VRGGNALGSNGSVVPYFIDQIQRENKITITDLRMTRYFLTLPEAVNLLITATYANISGGIFVMKMPAFKIKDIAETLIEIFGNPRTTQITKIGMRPGEKIHEVLVSRYESADTYIYQKEYYLIHTKKTNYYDKVNFKEYTSNTKVLGKKEILGLLTRGGFIT